MRPKGYIPKRIAFIYSDSIERGGDIVVPAYIAGADNPMKIGIVTMTLIQTRKGYQEAHKATEGDAKVKQVS